MLLIILKIAVYLMILIKYICKKLFLLKLTLTPHLEHDCFNVTNESTVAHNSKTESFSHDLTHICTRKVNPTWVNTNEKSESNCINDNNEGLLTNDQAVA